MPQTTATIRRRIESMLAQADAAVLTEMIENLIAEARYADAIRLADELDRREAVARREAAIARLAGPRVCESCGG
jgi:hypothetical protein